MVEPTSLALLTCQRSADRSGATWQAVLEPLTDLRLVVSDQAKGIAAGIAAATIAQGRGSAGRPPIDHGLDVFHTAQDAQRALRRPWRAAVSACDAADQADAQVADAKRSGRDARSVAGAARFAREHAAACLADLERQHVAWERARAALAVFRPDGTLNDREHAEDEIRAAVVELPGPDWRKARNALTDRRALTFLDRLHERLRIAVPADGLRAACVRRWWLRHHRPKANAPATAGSLGEVLDAVIRDRDLDPAEQAAYDRVAAVLRTTVRASSAVEGINSVLRMHQGRHRRMTQGMLDLKRLYWNCRRPTTGRRRGKSPYELLGVPLPSTDFWALLHHPPQPPEALSNKQLVECDSAARTNHRIVVAPGPLAAYADSARRVSFGGCGCANETNRPHRPAAIAPVAPGRRGRQEQVDHLVGHAVWQVMHLAHHAGRPWKPRVNGHVLTEAASGRWSGWRS